MRLPEFKKFWNTALHDGVTIVNEKARPIEFSKSIEESVHVAKSTGNDFTVILQANHNLGDGRYASNGFLQELPHPISKIVWDNYAAISLQTANDLGVKNDDMINISVNDKLITAPELDDAVYQALEIIGNAVNVNTVFVFENSFEKESNKI